MRTVKNDQGRVMRDIDQGHRESPLLASIFSNDLDKAGRIYNQALNPKTKDKLYCWHASEVECIGKGKVNKGYEFGCKASYVTTNKSNFIVGAMALHGNPYDGHTLKPALRQVKTLSRVKPQEAYVDLGYRNHGINHDDTKIILARQKQGVTKSI